MMVDIKHIQQINDGHNWKCGAVCLEMVLNYYNIPCDQDEIWNAIKSSRRKSSNQYFALTTDVAKYAASKGLKVTICKAKSDCIAEVLNLLDANNCPAILSLMEPKSQNSHFIIFTGIRNNLYYFVDPNTNKHFIYYKLVTIKDIWSPRPDIDVAGYILIAFGDIDIKNLSQYCDNIVPITDGGTSCPPTSHT